MHVACVDLPLLPLQLVWRAEPELRAHAVVVIDEDRPQGTVLWACEKARAVGVLSGQRYAHALGLHGNLRARVVAGKQIDAAIVELRSRLHGLSPRVEPATVGQGNSGKNCATGTFWLDGDGLERIDFGVSIGGTRAWALAIQGVVDRLGYLGAVVVGFSRFASYALARAQRTGILVLGNEAEERAAAAAVPLARLDIDPKLRDALARLGVTTLGQMVRLPAGGILERFGPDAYRLYQLAAGERWDPIVAVPPPETPDEQVTLDDDIENSDQIMFALRPALARLLARIASRGRAITALHVELTLRHAVGNTELHPECIKPATATLDERVLIRLVHLRISTTPPAAPVHALRLWADDVAATREQLALFTSRPRRDLRAANEAIAHLRAELGEDSVVRAVLRDGHLPEARFGWERLGTVVAAEPLPKAVRPLVRRLHARPQPLAGGRNSQMRNDGWLLSGLEYGAVVRILGPYVVSGGWWARELRRDYHFAELRRGDCLWVYYDRNRRQWFWHGGVE